MENQAAMMARSPGKLLGGCVVACAVLTFSCSSDADTPMPSDGGHSSDAAGTGGVPTTNGGAGGSASPGGSGGQGGLAGGAGSGGSPQAGGASGGSGGGSGGTRQECASPQVAQLSSTRHTAHPLGSTQASNGFYEYLPPGYGDGCPRPLLVFFPGSGELGNGVDGLDKLLLQGPPKLIDQDQWPNARPFVVLSVQHDKGCTSADNVDGLLTYALANYDIDPNRIYLTGLSCGAFRSWDYLGKYGGQRVAAIVPIAGDGRRPWTAAGCDLGQAAIWAFHGDADLSVAPAGSIDPITNLMGCPAPPRKPVLLTIYPGVDHVGAWTITYDLGAGHDPYAWLLAQSK